MPVGSGRGKRLGAVQWTGLDSFEQELRVITSTLVDEANGIMRESVEAARADIAAAYPAKSGNLRRGLIVRPKRGTVIAGYELLQTAPHGWIYEHGTKDRETTSGANRGHMTARPTFEPRAQAYRRSAIADIVFRLYAHGAARVTGQDEEVGETV